MPTKCTVCEHKKREQIDRDVLEGVPLATIARIYSLGDSSVRRHVKNGHIDVKQLTGKEGELVNEDDLLADVKRLRRELNDIYAYSRRAGVVQHALASVEKSLRAIEVQARLIGQYDMGQKAVSIVFNNPQFILLVDTIEGALKPYPEAKKAVIERLDELNRSGIAAS